MAHPTDSAKEIIRNYINTSISGGFANSDVYLCDTLNNPYFSGNPVAQDYIFTNFQAPTVFSVISPSSVKNVLNCPGTAVALLPLLNTLPHTKTDNAFLNAWAQAFETSEIVTPSEYVSITGVINRLIPDPSYQSGVSWAYVNLNRPCDIDDITASR